jgi:hypothetical protein
MDINATQDDAALSIWAYAISGVFMGLRHAGCAWACWPPLGISLYLVHVAAIAGGLKQPYVEVDIPTAATTLGLIYPAGIFIAVGVGIRVALSAMGWFRHRDGLPVRFFSQTGVIAVLCTGIGLQVFSWSVSPNETLYAAGYSEWRFFGIRTGMAQDEVEKRLGPPLIKVPWENGRTCWMYTRQRTGLSDYWRRWIFMENGKVQDIVSDYWYD